MKYKQQLSSEDSHSITGWYLILARFVAELCDWEVIKQTRRYTRYQIESFERRICGGNDCACSYVSMCEMTNRLMKESSIFPLSCVCRREALPSGFGVRIVVSQAIPILCTMSIKWHLPAGHHPFLTSRLSLAMEILMNRKNPLTDKTI